MTPLARDCLKKDDLTVFSSGACHIFAVQLTQKLPDEEYEIFGISKKYSPAYEPFDNPVSHVVASIKGCNYIVDVEGIRSFAEFEKCQRLRLSKICPEQEQGLVFGIHAIDQQALLQGTEIKISQGLVNQWGHTVDPDFVSESIQRASTIISSNPSKFRLSGITVPSP
jgi:hypothetical protein